MPITYSYHFPDYKKTDQFFDLDQFESQVFQRPFQYLSRLDQKRHLDDIRPHIPEGTQMDCLQILLRYCQEMCIVAVSLLVHTEGFRVVFIPIRGHLSVKLDTRCIARIKHRHEVISYKLPKLNMHAVVINHH